ncbi:kinase-like domain-containing protein, partial [Parasitella parasitica]
MAASSYATPRIARSKSGADLLFDRMKHEQFRHEEQLAIEYLNSKLDLSLSLDNPLFEELKDGVLLCNLVNKLKPGTIKHVGQRDLSFIKMDNITRFLQGARQLGLKSAQLFETIDLFEAKDMTAVIHTILALSCLTEKQIAAAHDQQELLKQQLQERLDASENNQDENDEIIEFAAGHQSINTEDRSSSSNTRDSDQNNEDDEDEKPNTKYRDVRDIFGGFSSEGNDSRLRLNRDALAASRKSGLRSTYTAPSDTYDHDDDYQHHKVSRTTPSSPTSNSFSRPPKSPLRLPPRYDDHNGDLPSLDPMATHSSVSSFNSSVSAMLPKTPKNASIRNKPKDMLEDMTNQQQKQKKQQRRLSSPVERNKRQNNTFPNRNNNNGVNASSSSKKRADLEMMKEEVAPPVKGGSLGHKLDRQYRETASEILSKKPAEDDKEERLLSHTKDDQTTTHYQLGNCIGKGQFGSVYRALDLATGEIVAVKRLLFENGELDQEVMKEVALLKTLSHSNVIRYLGFIQSKHSVNIILEFAENGSLMSTLKAFGAFPEKLVASFCMKILNGLEYLHQNQVVHCDLKAANILTTKTGDVKLTDFGVSLNLKIKGADAGSVSGTPNWMAPEVIELKGASTKSDIWSLGCTLVELVTGKPPYADMIAMSAMFRIVEDQCPPLPENISSDMKDFLEACFQKDPESRPSATQLKQHPWILQNQQRIKKTETYSHDLSSYLRNHPQPVPLSEASDEDQSQPEEMDQSNLTLRNSSGIDMGESQMTLYDDDEEDSEQQVERLKVPLGLRDEEDYITHRFIHTSFGKVVECKVCGDVMTAQSIFCEICALICHEHCKKSAFSCPPKVNEQQPSYDWVFSAKIYNRSRKSHDIRVIPNSKNSSIRKTSPVQLKPEDAESIRQYALALGLTPQEEQALNGNQALLSHTLLLQQQNKIDPGTLRHKAMTTRSLGKNEKKKRHLNGRRQSEEC